MTIEWSNPATARIVAMIGVRTGLHFRDGQHVQVENEISMAMGAAGFDDLRAYGEALLTSNALFDDLLVEITVGETYFFRDEAFYRWIRARALPDLISRRGASRPIRIWSAGCASGEEPYSLAILLDQEGRLSESEILGTDISRRSLQRAKEGSYRTWSLRGTGRETVMPYMSQSDGQFLLKSRIRNAVRFEYLNLALDIYPSIATGTQQMDLILCRNVFIYFDRETIDAVAHRFLRSLVPGGWLVTSASDPSIAESVGFETEMSETGIVYRRPFEVSASVPEILPSARIEQDLRHTAPAESAERDPLAEAREAILRGDYVSAIELTETLQSQQEACILHVKAMANIDLDAAERCCVDAMEQHRLDPELHYLHAVLLLELNRDRDAAVAAKRVVYLDASQPMGHFTLGTILRRQNDIEGATRAFRNAAQIATEMNADESVDWSDGECAGDIAQAALVQMSDLKNQPRVW